MDIGVSGSSAYDAVVGYHNHLQSSRTCLDSHENGKITMCPWDHRVKGLFFHQTAFSISLSNVKSFIQDVQKLVDLEPKALCVLDLYNGVLMRYVKASSAFLGKQEDGVDFDITYYRSKDPMTSRLYEDILKEVKARYDPLGIFSSNWIDRLLGLKNGVTMVHEGCALEELCVCSQDVHCAPSKGYYYRPGRVYKDATSFIQDVQKLVDLEPKALCVLDLYNGVLMRYVKASSAFLGKQEDGVDFDITYYRSKDPMTPRLYEDILEEVEQLGLFKYEGLPHWGKNRNVALDGVIKKYKNVGEFLKVKARYDPLGIFSSNWTDQLLGLKNGVTMVHEVCALEELCVCSQDVHCAPSKGYYCRPGRVYKDATGFRALVQCVFTSVIARFGIEQEGPLRDRFSQSLLRRAFSRFWKLDQLLTLFELLRGAGYLSNCIGFDHDSYTAAAGAGQRTWHKDACCPDDIKKEENI
ncbi:hypothetical protein TEA_000644 [Camellia sinensis var. sinensis]|uniref:Uncharacterized protein n=1 Tax=Camellia sinensis var. sinensis TaxID=542762 RepID=A0A4S4EJH9_CAMSN|nr:hypothetical protein TEA_000644 [Camellia sinensis var. sinensis]